MLRSGLVPPDLDRDMGESRPMETQHAKSGRTQEQTADLMVRYTQSQKNVPDGKI